MRDLFDEDVQAIALSCANCGVSVEIARSALSLFESEDKVLCVECLVRSEEGPVARSHSLEERAALIDEVVENFSSRLRTVLLRSVRPDLSWNNGFHIDDWHDPEDSTVAAHAPGIWYAGKDAAQARRSMTR